MNPTGSDLQRQVEEFGQEMAELLCATLPSMPDPTIETLASSARYVVHVGADGRGVPLFVGGEELAKLKARILCRLDHAERYLAVESSSFQLLANIDRTPIFRFDYVREMSSAPNAHIQVHAHRGALSHLLSRSGHPTPHDLASLHIPVGGSRFRPCLEDLVQFAIQECRFDSLNGWEEHVAQGREAWRRRQVAATVRAIPDEAIRALEELNYTVLPPTELPTVSQKALRHW